MKPFFIIAVVALVFTAISCADASVAAAGEPGELLETWQTALADGDYPTYAACLHSGTREIPEYGSREAMRFWAHEIERLREQGFEGLFEIEVATDVGPRFPVGTLLAHPIVGGVPTRDAIVLIQEAGHWKILRLFS